MKFVLALILCSQTQQICMPPHQWPELFNSQYDCLMFGYKESEKKMKEIHKYTTIIFSASIGTAIVAILLTGVLYFKSLSGVPVILNTSFNENEPIVNTPDEAINCFLRTKMDCLALENYLILRQ